MDINAIQNFFYSGASTSVAGFLIIAVSVVAIYSQRKTARQKASLEFLDKLSSNRRLIKSAKFLRDYHFDNNKSVTLIATSEEYKNLQEQIDPILNYFEPISIGVRIGIYDRCTMYLSRKQQIIHTFEYSKPYIEKIREQLKNHCLFENLEWFSACISKPWHYRIFCKITQFFRCHKKK
ncbi:DUF4760 domain-containing protein [Bathymodiolus thermophilus thioautotrophic gill symbiont]|uniref:DUF4760 domain-containing protein n=1 Tax=Bathymodiolus thermophilus thioautotrophic gill symbiont TaxID=2360 RepID=A0A8H8XB43_9GAMM|nr:DUF4760 domain-containing protein [Bathymodiolus thermophilus thioautotrophic gill symbiont]CAB5499076.1 hypothetical protein THERMOS_964 [Bathymodiolus thermophilus thioautotrophic gill symbiont]